MEMETGITVLVVEDFGVTRRMMVEALGRIGFQEILEATDGREAVGILGERADVGLVISDWNMPEMNGYDLLEWVRSHRVHGGTPFVMATSQAESREAARAESAGASGFITKPFTVEELKGVLERVLGGGPAEAAPAPGAARSRTGKIRLSVAHIQITDHLVLGVLKHFIDSGRITPEYFELDTRCMSGWNPVQKALENGEVDIAFTLAPIAMDLFSAGVPIRLILFAHRNGSVCVRSRRARPSDGLATLFKGKVFYLPHVLSIHHMLSHLFLRQLNLNAGFAGAEDVDVTYEVVPPVKMPELLLRGEESCGFLVAQPIGKKAIDEGGAELLFLSGELWEYHPCCVVAARASVLESHPDAVHELVEKLVQAGLFAQNYPGTTAKVAVDFLDPRGDLHLSHEMLESVLREPHGIKTDDLFPTIDELDRMQRYMTERMGVGTLVDLERLVDLRFAEGPCRHGGKEPKASVFHDPAEIVQRIIDRRGGTG